MVKKRSFLKKTKQKIQSPPTQKSFTISILKKTKSPNYYYILALFVILPNSTLSVFNKKQQQKNQQTYKKQKNTFYLIHSLFFWTLYNNSVFTISYFTCVLHYSSSTILLKKK